MLWARWDTQLWVEGNKIQVASFIQACRFLLLFSLSLSILCIHIIDIIYIWHMIHTCMNNSIVVFFRPFQQLKHIEAIHPQGWILYVELEVNLLFWNFHLKWRTPAYPNSNSFIRQYLLCAGRSCDARWCYTSNSIEEKSHSVGITTAVF